MKQIGITNEGKVLVEIDALEAAQLKHALDTLNSLGRFDLIIQQTSEAPVLEVAKVQRFMRQVKVKSPGKPSKIAPTRGKRSRDKDCCICLKKFTDTSKTNTKKTCSVKCAKALHLAGKQKHSKPGTRRATPPVPVSSSERLEKIREAARRAADRDPLEVAQEKHSRDLELIS